MPAYFIVRIAPSLRCARALLLLVSISFVAGWPLLGVPIESDCDGCNDLRFDGQSDLHWLDWPIIVGPSFNDVTAQLGPGGDFFGFRYPRSGEYTTFLTGNGLARVLESSPLPGRDSLRLLRSFLGITEIRGVAGISDAVLGTPCILHPSLLCATFPD